MNSEPHRAGWPAQKTTKESALPEFYTASYTSPLGQQGRGRQKTSLIS